MANFCTNCSIMLGTKETINVFKIFSKLTFGQVKEVKCDCCGMGSIVKTESGELKVIYLDDNFEQELELSQYEFILF